MKLLFMSQYYPPETGACSNRIGGFARRLAARGHDVTVITGFPNYPCHRLYPGYSRAWLREEREGEIRLLRTWLSIRIPSRPRDRFLNYLGFFFSSLSAALFHAGKTDIIIATTGPILVGFAGALASMVRRIPFVLDLRDVWPERIIAAGEFKNPLALRILEWMERFLYRRAERILCVTRGVRENLLLKGVPETKLRVITNGTDTSLYDREREKPFSWESRGLPSSAFAVVYAGTLGLLQDHRLVLDAAAGLRGRSDIHFVLVGEGVRRASLRDEARRRGLENVHFLDNLPREDLARLLTRARIGINTNTAVDHNRMALPVKMFDYMAAGLPVVIANGGDAERIVREEGIGICVAPGDAEAFTRALLDLYGDADACRRMGAKGLALARLRYDISGLADEVEKILLEIGGA